MRISHLAAASLLALAAACSNDGVTTAPAPDVIPEAGASVAARGRADEGRGGTVYLLSNDATANQLVVYPRRNDGLLGAPARYATGGRGTGGGLGNQYGLVFGDEADVLYAINAGSDEISAFDVSGAEPRLLQRIASGGNQPISLAVHDDLLYVLNDGTTANITGFRVGEHGRLRPLVGSTRARSAPAGAVDGAQISFSPDGRTLVVTEKAANLIVTYPVLPGGRTGAPRVQASSGPTPFGFDFTRNGTLIVSEAAGGAAGASTVSSYSLDRASRLQVVSGSLANGQSAVCWITVTSNGRTAFATNTASGTVSWFGINPQGALSFDAADNISTGTGSGPTDMALSRGDRYLYVRNGGNGTLSIFRTADDGSLSPVATVTDLPGGSNGLAAR